MTEMRECPECGSYDTESVHQEFEDDIALQVRICNDCPAEYEVRWGNPIKETTQTEAKA